VNSPYKRTGPTLISKEGRNGCIPRTCNCTWRTNENGAEETQSMTLRGSSGFRYWVGEVLGIATWFGAVGEMLEGIALELSGYRV
jgi:hypothetical protein